MLKVRKTRLALEDARQNKNEENLAFRGIFENGCARSIPTQNLFVQSEPGNANFFIAFLGVYSVCQEKFHKNFVPVFFLRLRGKETAKEL